MEPVAYRVEIKRDHIELYLSNHTHSRWTWASRDVPNGTKSNAWDKANGYIARHNGSDVGIRRYDWNGIVERIAEADALAQALDVLSNATLNHISTCPPDEGEKYLRSLVDAFLEGHYNTSGVPTP